MESKTEKIDPLPKSQKEIYQMARKIVSRYHVYNFNLALSIATILFENGIGLDKFKARYYYQGTFYLDEIVLHFINKQTQASSLFPPVSTPTNTKVINYNTAKEKINKRKKERSCQNYQKLKP